MINLVFQVSIANYSQLGLFQFVEISNFLSKQGINTHIICTGREEEPKTETLSNTLMLHRVSIPQEGKLNKIRFCLETLRTIKDVVNSNKPPYIVHVYFSPSIVILPFLAKWHKNLEKVKWILDIRSVPLKNKFKFLALYNVFHRFYDAIVFIDELVQKQIRKSDKPQYVVPLGSNFSNFRPNKLKRRTIRNALNIKEEDFVYMYIGEISQSRKTYILIEAFKIFLEQNKNRNVKLILLGTGDAFDFIKNKISVYKLQKYSIMPGFIPYSEVPSYLNAADVGISFVPQTKEYNIQPPRKTVDYLACGLPVIATDTKGNRRFVKDRENGFLVSDTPESIASGMRKLLNSQQYEIMKKHARQSVIQFDYENIVTSILLPVYKRVVNDY